LISFISRLVEQKGLDLILNDPDKFFNLPLCWFFLGVGEAAYENSLTEYAKKYPNLHVEMAFNDSLARFVYGASDMLAMPSRFEPCGISQMIAMRYGTIPVVRKTGGLIDTVIDYRFNPVLNNGFQFDNYRPDEFIFTLERALNWYNDTPELWKVMVKNAMDSDFSWKIPVQEYLNIYLG
jgi:starch synthase